jgi:hypothetical protein
VDFANFAVKWFDSGCGICGRTDLTGDGNVGPDDLRQFGENWLTGFE